MFRAIFCPKHVELILEINKLLVLHLVGFSILLYLQWWCTLKHKSSLFPYIFRWTEVSIWNVGSKISRPSASQAWFPGWVGTVYLWNTGLLYWSEMAGWPPTEVEVLHEPILKCKTAYVKHIIFYCVFDVSCFTILILNLNTSGCLQSNLHEPLIHYFLQHHTHGWKTNSAKLPHTN